MAFVDSDRTDTNSAGNHVAHAQTPYPADPRSCAEAGRARWLASARGPATWPQGRTARRPPQAQGPQPEAHNKAPKQQSPRKHTQEKEEDEPRRHPRLAQAWLSHRRV